VILLTFVVVGASGIVTYAAWSVLSELGTLERGVASLFSWIVTFYIGSFLLWKTVLLVSRQT